MANQVYANNMEIACKAASGKSIAAFPDVCFTPPQTPATPPGVPIPYPNTGMASDTSAGSKSVKISGKEVMLKDKSYFKTSTGDEAGSAPKKGVVTSKIKGKIFFTAWSMDVKFEGENVVRHMDIGTHNHGSTPGNTAPWTYADRMAFAEDVEQCQGERDRAKTACGDTKQKAKCPDNSKIKSAEKDRYLAKKSAGENFESDPEYLAQHKKVKAEYDAFAKTVNDDPCQRALRCFLTPYKPNRCCPSQTGDHLIDAASFGQRDSNEKIPGWSKYDTKKAPVMCAEGPNQTTATHGQMHLRRGVVALEEQDSKGEWTRTKATSTGAKAARRTFPDSQCSEACLEAQLNKYHDKAKDEGEEKPIKANATMTSDPVARAEAKREHFGNSSR